MRLSRRQEQFQNQVQVQLNILDDKIKRNIDYIAELEAGIANAQDSITRLNNNINQKEHTNNGKIKRKNAEWQTRYSSYINNHQKVMAELVEQQAKREELMREDFEKTLDAVDKMTKQREIEKTKPIDDEIKKTISLINKFKESANHPNDSIDSDTEQDVEHTHAMEHNRIESLEQKLKEQNQDRLESLMEAKRQLMECVNTLEEMENKHHSQMEQLKDELDNMDNKYSEQVKRGTEKQKKETAATKRTIAELESQVKSLTKSMHRTEKRQKEAIQKAAEESGSLRAELVVVKRRESQKKEGDNEIQALQKQLSELNSQLNEREDILFKMRSDNETMKREIARIHHEKEISKRRSALNIS